MHESLKNLRPIFTGKTVENEEISLYQHVNRPEELHILFPNDELCQLSTEAQVSTWFDPFTQEMRVDIVSPEWTGQAIGSKWELLRSPLDTE